MLGENTSITGLITGLIPEKLENKSKLVFVTVQRKTDWLHLYDIKINTI